MAANLKNYPRRFHTLEEYFALERVGDARYEYWDGDIICMSGGSRQHAIIGGNILVSLSNQLKGRQCRAFNGELAIKTPAFPPYRYPDASVICGEIVTEKVNGIDALINPVLVVEVLSPGTELVDRNQKKAAYQTLPSVQEYLLVAQDAPHVTQFMRQGDLWARKDYGNLSAVVLLSSVDCQSAFSEIYEGIVFD